MSVALGKGAKFLLLLQLFHTILVPILNIEMEKNNEKITHFFFTDGISFESFRM